jgi:tryptophan 7-halogenase
MKIIESLTIVGGGTAGWLTAAYFCHQFPNFKINLIDKEISTPVGVGEGTLLNFSTFMDACGFKQPEWMLELDAVHKAGILFPKFISDDKIIWHPFSYKKSFDEWTNNQNINFKEEILSLYKESINFNTVRPDNITSYAFNINCSKLVKFIQKKIINKINFINSEVNTINRDENNHIINLELKNQIKIKSDLYIDCTGFKALLNNNKKKINLNKRLICDTAIAAHIPYTDNKEKHPYVRSEAVECGWIWDIPVADRIGSGIVFNRTITKPEDALKIFNKFWNVNNKKGKINAKLIDWTPNYDENFWHENVIHIGLSAGFIEPLESTGVSLIMEGIYHFASRIEKLYYNPNDCKMYNQVMKMFLEESIDFVNMHYVNNKKTHKFWKIANHDLQISDRQLYYIDLLENTNISLDALIRPNNFQKYNFFTTFNWLTWMIQLDYKVKARNGNIKRTND